MRTRMILLGLPLALAVITATAFSAAPQRPSPAPAIPAPTTWVPFTADLVIQDPGKPAINGRFWRRSDGSTRTESWLETTPDKIVVSIKNIPTESFYFNDEKQWNVAPMRLPPGGWHPSQYRQNHPGLTPYQHKLGLRKGDDGNLASERGLSAYVLASDGGTLAYIVPELNFFQAVRHLPTGRQQRYFNIEQTETSNEALFMPPPGAQLRAIDKPMGIEFTPFDKQAHVK